MVPRCRSTRRPRSCGPARCSTSSPTTPPTRTACQKSRVRSTCHTRRATRSCSPSPSRDSCCAGSPTSATRSVRRASRSGHGTRRLPADGTASRARPRPVHALVRGGGHAGPRPRGTRAFDVFDHGAPFGLKTTAGQSVPLSAPFGAVFVAWPTRRPSTTGSRAPRSA